MKTCAFSVVSIAYILNILSFPSYCFFCVCGQMFLGFLHFDVELDIALNVKLQYLNIVKHLHHI